MKNKLYSLHITYTGSHNEEDWENLTLNQAKKKLDQIRQKGYDLMPMLVFGEETTKNGDVFLWAIKNKTI